MRWGGAQICPERLQASQLTTQPGCKLSADDTARLQAVLQVSSARPGGTTLSSLSTPVRPAGATNHNAHARLTGGISQDVLRQANRLERRPATARQAPHFEAVLLCGHRQLLPAGAAVAGVDPHTGVVPHLCGGRPCAGKGEQTRVCRDRALSDRRLATWCAANPSLPEGGPQQAQATPISQLYVPRAQMFSPPSGEQIDRSDGWLDPEKGVDTRAHVTPPSADFARLHLQDQGAGRTHSVHTHKVWLEWPGSTGGGPRQARPLEGSSKRRSPPAAPPTPAI